MQVSVETTDNKLERRLRIQVPAERIEKEVEERLRSLSKSARLKGFRPGKAPFKVIEQQYGPQVRQEVLGDIISTTYSEALQKEKLQPAGGPRIEGTKAEPGAALEYTAIIELFPQIELQPMTLLKIERPVVEITAADVDKMIENLRDQRATWNTVERVAANGDQLTVDFDGKLDGGAFPGGGGKGIAVVLGSGRFVGGFESSLVGAKAGETRTFEVVFPSDYPNQQLAGKPVEFTVTVHAVAEKALPVVDDAFCAAFGVEEGGVEKLKVEVRANMQHELDQVLRRTLKQQVMDQLLDKHTVDVPGAMVRDELQRLKAEALQRMGATGKKNAPSLPDDLFDAQARRRVSLGLLIAEVIRKNGIQLDRERVQKTIGEIAESYDDPQKVYDAYAGNRRLMDGVEAMVMEEQVVDLVLGQASVTDKPAGFQETMNPRNEG